MERSDDWLRTRMALETTLAGWVRTASALIAFGFAIVQFFENYNLTHGSTGDHLARYLGLVMIGIGSVATAIAVWEYRKVMNYLEGETFQGIARVPGVRRIYPAVVVAVLLCLVGLLAFFTILLGAETSLAGKALAFRTNCPPKPGLIFCPLNFLTHNHVASRLCKTI